jgi:HipA-like protein
MELREKAKQIKKDAKQYINGLLGASEETPAPMEEGREASFSLTYEKVSVGTLSLDSGTWIFQYSDQFREREDLRPIVEFPETGRTYRSKSLWPFFLMRIPSTKQEAIQKITDREEIDITDQVQLLSRFGKETIANPYRLVPA